MGSNIHQNSKFGGPHRGFVYANIYEAAILNKILPPGYRVDFEENVLKEVEKRKNEVTQKQNQAKKTDKKKKVTTNL